jgi:hypothetical protein
VISLKTRRGWALLLLLLTGLGLACAALLYLTHEMHWPEPFERLGTLAGRVLYWIALPGQAIGLAIFPWQGHHYDPRLWILAGMITPIFWATVLLAVRSGMRALHRGGAKATDEAASPSRRAFLGKAALGAVALTASGVGAHGTLIAPADLKVRRRRFPVRDLPAALEGLTLAHVSDTHLGPFMTETQLRGAMEFINVLRPDVVLLTGDYVHRTPDSIVPGIGVLGHLRPRLGSVAVLGNHDHWEGTEACRREFRRAAIPLVDNDRLFLTRDGLTDSPRADALCLAGLGDLWEDDVDLDRALRDVPASMPRFVLAHNPDTAEQVGAAHRIDLMLSGHTHGGQIALPLIGVPAKAAVSAYGMKYIGGLCQGPICPVLVSRGIGISGVPMRLGVPPEVGLITLTRA